ncbi:radical SAM protein [Puniceibacterium sp. IMCC21224]|uniref:radical SAM/SPASM domain-containing protein n=1 Tax=Puniceibacterium sp. IMCC21224 TaxID=1618204 RepID=UPI00064D97FD|nr:radical SAM protein [Puniceibacterium sp. IMCC21224]KMK67580.1 radical SAM additional 4Fe4S-binding SPASM domain [Puniceibacterium sp. IMCC21224]
MTATLNLIVKTTRKCNLRCSYCHDWRSRGRPISFEVLAHLVARALQTPDQRLVNFIWHGGEPLLLGMDFFRKTMALQKEFLQPGQYVINSIQTNGTILTPEWCAFLRKHKFTLGISIDGPREIHDMTRSHADGRSSFDQVKANIAMAREHDLNFGILMVLNRHTGKLSPKQIFDFIVGELGVRNFSFLPAVPDNIPGHYSGEAATTDFFPMARYESFMKDIFDHWYALDDPTIKVRELDGLLRSLMKGNPQVCTLSGGCIGENYHIEPEGDIYHCDKYVGDPAYRLGNILETDFTAIRQDTAFRTLIADEARRLERLKSCPNYTTCNGGCPHDRYIAQKYETGHDGRCCGQSSLIDHIRASLAADLPAELESA